MSKYFKIGLFRQSLTIKKNIRKTEQEKYLERVYNPMEKAITIFDIEIKNDKLNSEQQFKKFESACLDVKHNYGHLIDNETINFLMI